MPVLEIPCTRLSRKILLSEHGADPIPVTPSHKLWVFLRPHTSLATTAKARVISPLETSFHISVKNTLHQSLLKHHNDAGVLLHRFHLDQLLRFVWAATFAGIPSRAALRSFQELHNISDDDYDLDSGYRAWLRYKKRRKLAKKSKKNKKQTPLNVLNYSRPGALLPLPDEDLQKVITEIHTRLEKTFPDLPGYVFQQVSIYVHFVFGRRRADFIANKFNRSLSTTYAAVQRIKGFVDVDERFADIIQAPELAE